MLKEALGQLRRDWNGRLVMQLWPTISVWRRCDLDNNEVMERTESLLGIVNRLEKMLRRRG